MDSRSRNPIVLECLVVVSLVATTLALSLRRIASNDLGYHLAYGESLFLHRCPVDHDPALYTLPAPSERERFPPGPGCWFDDDGNYRFPNANWLSQGLVWLAYSKGGVSGLTVLVAALMVTIVALQYSGLRRAGLSSVASFAIVSLLLLLLQFRLEPRPELFGYAVLSAQLHVLLVSAGREGGPRVRSLLALVAMQVLLVNLHSYFLLGIVISGCFLADALLRGVARRAPIADRERAPDAFDRIAVRRLALLVLAQVAACFVNPWTWRLALLPVETIAYLHSNHVSDVDHLPHHPWSSIEEFHPLPMPWQTSSEPPSLLLFHGMLVLAAIALVAAPVQRRAGHALLLLAMSAVAVSMRRNVPTAALILFPVAAMVLAPCARRIITRAAIRAPRAIGIAPLAAVALYTSTVIGLVLAGRWYGLLEMPGVAGVGFSDFQMPMRMARWLDEHPPAGRLWTDFNTSSNLHFFCKIRPAVPILTNTWAYPPETMRKVLSALVNGSELEVERSGIGVVAAETDSTAAPLVSRLARDADWALVHLEPRYAAFVHHDARNDELFRRFALREETFDLAAWLREWPASEVSRRALLRAAARTFREIGWSTTAIRCLEQSVADDANDADAWSELGALHLTRAQEQLRAGAADLSRADLEAAQRTLDRARALRPEPSMDRQNRALLERMRAQLPPARGAISR